MTLCCLCVADTEVEDGAEAPAHELMLIEFALTLFHG